MKTFGILLLAFAAWGQLAMAGWEIAHAPKLDSADGERYVLIYQPDAGRGIQSILASLEALSSAGHLRSLHMLTMHELVDDTTFQKEVFEQMERIAPEALKAARLSAGNMHNPKMTALRARFAQAVMSTQTVTALNEALGKYRMKIVRPSFEKLELHKKDQVETFNCSLWLGIEPVAAATSEKP